MAAVVEATTEGGDAKPVKARRGLKALQKELVEVKGKYKDNVKVLTSKQKDEASKGPWPIVVQKTCLPTRDAQNFDVTSVTIKLCIDAKFDPEQPEKLPVRVEVPPSSELPDVLRAKIAETVEEKWKGDLCAKGSGEGWLLAHMMSWLDKNYLRLIRLMPELIEHYIGCDSEGCSQRRFTIVAPTEVAQAQDDASSSDGVDEEEAARAAEYYAQKELERKRKEVEDARRKKAEGARIRAMYEEGKLHAAPPKLSKKEEMERRKKKQGVRTAKTAPRAKPFEGEGAKERRKGKTKT